MNIKNSLKDKIMSVGRVNKYLYNIMSKNNLTPTSEAKWKTQILNNNENIEWGKIYSNIFQSTIDTTLRSFQYKFLMRIIPTNKLLYKYKYVQSSLCSLCNSSIESLEHLFWECCKVQPLWKKLNSFIKSKSINIILTKDTALLSITSNSPFKSICNTLIILMKYFIFKNKAYEDNLSFEAFHHFLQRRIKIEEQIALDHDNHDAHSKKWQIISKISSNNI